jgi:hypothetical protein
VNRKPPLTLATLQPEAIPGKVANLAERNLKRGLFMSLPSGQAVAQAMGETPLTEDELRIGKATYEDAFPDKDKQIANRRLMDISREFEGKAPLWVYVLAEALEQWRKEVVNKKLKGDDADHLPVHLGPVGGRLVAETLIGLLVGDSHSVLSQAPNWVPRIPKAGATHTVGDMVKYGLRL